MKKLVVASLAAAALTGSVFAVGAFAAQGDPAPPAAADAREFLLDARVAGMKAALKLTPDQEKNWAPFEAAVRDAAKAMGEEMRAMREEAHEGERASPVVRLNMLSDRLAKASTELKAIADAAKPLYDSLDETQKRHFGVLLLTLREQAPHGGMMMEHEEHHGEDEPK
jgi:Spy/CpxP family protein refolding chaperone